MSLTATYRLQLHQGFGFAQAQEILPYLDDLGVSHLYLSPILQAVPGSMHGYDVVDHTRISDDLGGRSGFVSLAMAAEAQGLGIIVDVVPNHMAFVAPESLNRPLWQVLKEGRDAPTADWFDIDWKAGGGRIGLPVLGDSLENVLANGELQLTEEEIDGTRQPVLRYYDHVLPIALGTESSGATGEMPIIRPDAPPPEPTPEEKAATVRAVLDRQHYRLTNWRDKGDALNYRRFFEVDELIAVRVELPGVFDATHNLLLELNHAGLIDGFRIDHPDGLADPAGYLERLRSKSRRGTRIWVEKILEGNETLPKSWACDGTTGYDAMRVIQAALVDPAAAPELTAQWEAAGGEHTLDEAVDDAKRQVVAQALIPEVERLTRRAREALPDRDPEQLRQAIVELLVAGQVYRAYVRPDRRLTDEARRRLAEAFSTAIASRPDLREDLEALIPLTVVPEDDAATDFAVRLQQTWGPVMAKGIEDTTFYRWHRLVALNEVGGDPNDLDHGSPQLMHTWAARQQATWPYGMTTLSTHDTKRSEDVRARLLAVAGDTESWAECSQLSRKLADAAGLDAETAHLIWQTMLGVGHIAVERMEGYLLKAVREAKQHTAWVDGDPEYERKVLEFARQVRGAGPLYDAIQRALNRNWQAIRAVTLAQKVLALTLPGVPDVYQGCETLDLSLVDPDNRRPVHFGIRATMLGVVHPAEDAEAEDAVNLVEAPDGPGFSADDERPRESALTQLAAEKLLVTTRVLRMRREAPSLFGDSVSYAPVDASSEHVVGFTRARTSGRIGGAASRIAGVFGIGGAQSVTTLVTRAPVRLAATGGWGDHTVELPDGPVLDVITGVQVHGGTRKLAELLSYHPVAVLVQR